MVVGRTQIRARGDEVDVEVVVVVLFEVSWFEVALRPSAHVGDAREQLLELRLFPAHVVRALFLLLAVDLDRALDALGRATYFSEHPREPLRGPVRRLPAHRAGLVELRRGLLTRDAEHRCE